MPQLKKKSQSKLASKANLLASAPELAFDSPRSKRKQIVCAATKVFLKHGYEGTSIAKVAETAKVIKATIYSHFKDKKALFKAIMEALTVEKGVFEMEEGVRDLPADVFFKIIAGKMLDRNDDSQFRSLVRLVIGESGRFPELSQLFYQTISCRGNRMIASYLKSHPELRIKDPEAAAQIVTGALVYWMLSQEVMGGKFVEPIEQSRVVSMLETLFLDRSSSTQA